MTLTAIIAAAERHFGLEPGTIRARNRRPTVLRARQVAIWVARQQGYSLPAIGRAVARDHASVMFAVRRVDGNMAAFDADAEAVKRSSEHSAYQAEREGEWDKPCALLWSDEQWREARRVHLSRTSPLMGAV